MLCYCNTASHTLLLWNAKNGSRFYAFHARVNKQSSLSCLPRASLGPRHLEDAAALWPTLSELRMDKSNRQRCRWSRNHIQQKVFSKFKKRLLAYLVLWEEKRRTKRIRMVYKLFRQIKKVKRISSMTLGGKITYKLTSYLPIHCICAVVLVIISPDTARLPEPKQQVDKHRPQQIHSFIICCFQYYLVVKKKSLFIKTRVSKQLQIFTIA